MGTSWHLSHCDNSGKKKEKGGGVEGERQKNKKSTNAEKQPLKRKNEGHTTLSPTWFQIATTLRPHDLCETVHVYVAVKN